MGADSAISWTTHTFNGWWGCQKVSGACTNCYAERWAGYTGRHDLWGPPAASQRLPMAEAYWRQLPKWQAAAKAAGERHRVFCFSMADVFEDGGPWAEMQQAVRDRLWAAVPECPDLDFLLLTKRPENIAGMVPHEWLTWMGWPTNAWPGTSVESQDVAAERLDPLLALPAWQKWVSVEPLLGRLNLGPWLRHCGSCGTPRDDRGLLVSEGYADRVMGCGYCYRYPEVVGVGWIIVGGESGGSDERRLVQRDGGVWTPKNEAMAWVQWLRGQAYGAGIPFHFKQWGGPKPTSAGRELGGRTWDAVPIT